MNQESRSSSLPAIVCLVLAGALWLSWFWIAVDVIPRFERTFLDFRMKVPWHAEWTINFSRWIAKYYYVVAIMLLPLFLWAGYLAANGQQRDRVLTRIFFILLLAIPLAAGGLMLLSVLSTNAALGDALGAQ